MPRPKSRAKVDPTPAAAYNEPAPAIPHLKWPEKPDECSPVPRTFRVNRVNAYEWQAYVTEKGVEQAIGKPDLFELVEFKVRHIMRVEGQQEFLELKAKRTKEQEAAHNAKAAKDAAKQT